MSDRDFFLGFEKWVKTLRGKRRIVLEHAVSAVAKGLAVTMLALLKHPEREYKALSDDKRAEWETDFGPIPEPGERILVKRT